MFNSKTFQKELKRCLEQQFNIQIDGKGFEERGLMYSDMYTSKADGLVFWSGGQDSEPLGFVCYIYISGQVVFYPTTELGFRWLANMDTLSSNVNGDSQFIFVRNDARSTHEGYRVSFMVYQSANYTSRDLRGRAIRNLDAVKSQYGIQNVKSMSVQESVMRCYFESARDAQFSGNELRYGTAAFLESILADLGKPDLHTFVKEYLMQREVDYETEEGTLGTYPAGSRESLEEMKRSNEFLFEEVPYRAFARYISELIKEEYPDA